MTPVRRDTAIWVIKLQRVCAAQVLLKEELTHVREIVEDRWSVSGMTGGTSWVSSAGELGARAREDMECTLI